MQTVNINELLTSIFEKQIAIRDLADQLANEFDDIKSSDHSKAVAIRDLADKQQEHLNELENKLDSIEIDTSQSVETESGGAIMNKDSADFKAAVTHDQILEGEEKYRKSEKSIGITRRCLIAFLSKDKKELIEIVKEDEGAEAIMEIIEVANPNIEYLENVLSLIKTARNRLLLVMAEVHGDR